MNASDITHRCRAIAWRSRSFGAAVNLVKGMPLETKENDQNSSTAAKDRPLEKCLTRFDLGAYLLAD